MVMSRDTQIIQELSLLRYGKLFQRLNAKQKRVILDEGFAVSTWSDDKVEKLLMGKLTKKLFNKKTIKKMKNEAQIRRLLK